MGRVALLELESMPTQHVFRSMRRLHAKQLREQKLLELQLELGQLRYEKDLLHSEVVSWRTWYCEQRVQTCEQQTEIVLQELQSSVPTTATTAPTTAPTAPTPAPTPATRTAEESNANDTDMFMDLFPTKETGVGILIGRYLSQLEAQLDPLWRAADETYLMTFQNESEEQAKMIDGITHVIANSLDNSQAARIIAPLRATLAIWMPWRIGQAIAGIRQQAEKPPGDDT